MGRDTLEFDFVGWNPFKKEEEVPENCDCEFCKLSRFLLEEGPAEDECECSADCECECCETLVVVDEDLDKPVVKHRSGGNYSFRVTGEDEIDWERIDRERWEDAVKRGEYQTDAFVVSSKDFDGVVLLGISNDFLKLFQPEDDVYLCYQPFCWHDLEAFRWGQDYGLTDGHYRYYWVSGSKLGKTRSSLDAIRQIAFKVNVSGI